MIQALLTQYGLLILAILIVLESAGLPLPGETMLLLAAAAAAQGVLPIGAVIAVAALAAIVGDSLGYWTSGTRNIRVDYTYGYQPAPWEVKRAAMWIARNYLTGSNIPRNALSQVDELGTAGIEVVEVLGGELTGQRDVDRPHGIAVDRGLVEPRHRPLHDDLFGAHQALGLGNRHPHGPRRNRRRGHQSQMILDRTHVTSRTSRTAGATLSGRDPMGKQAR